jgi:AI-2 transport protein TqsA
VPLSQQRPHWAAVIILAIIAGVGALSVASAVFAPAACALFVMALVWPLQARLQAVMPKLAALAVTVVVLVAVFIVFGWVTAWAFGRVGRWTISEAPRFQMMYDQGVAWLEGHGIAVAGLWSEHVNAARLLRIVQTLTGRVNSALSFWIVVFVYVVLGLLEVEDLRARAAGLGDPVQRAVLLQGSAGTAAKIRRYMVVRTQMSLLTGLLVWGFASLVGLQLAGEWGVIAFTLNFIPFLGPLIATVFPTALALVQFESLQAAILVFACLNVIQFVVGSYVEPRVSGNALAMSPTVVLFAVFFWTYLWGLFGAFIGVPIMIGVLTFCAQHPSSRWIAHLLASGPGTPAPEVKGT